MFNRKSIAEKNHSGFTLLELMISIAIIGIMIFILMAVLRIGFRTVGAGEKKMNALERARTSLNILDAQIQSAFPLTHEENGEKVSSLKGGRDSLELATNFSIWEGEKGYVIVSYQVAEGTGGKKALTASETAIGHAEKRSLTLLDFFDNLYFEYYFKDPTEEEGKWVDQWTDKILSPEKIRLHLVSGKKDLALIMPLRASGAGSSTLVQSPPPSPLMKQPGR
jgi:prepilin-type N-terminal cleavage/methylation domain-containing protein